MKELKIDMRGLETLDKLIEFKDWAEKCPLRNCWTGEEYGLFLKLCRTVRERFEQK